MGYLGKSWKEFLVGFMSINIWSILAYNDVITKYRRTLLGPLWHVLSHAATIFGLGFLYSRVFNQPLAEYFIFISAGLTVWSLIVLPLIDGSGILIKNKSLILAYETPISTHIMRSVAGYFILFLHNFMVYVAVIIFIKNPINLNILFFFPALIIILIAVTGSSLILSVFGARYRDLAPAMNVVVSVVFLITPIFWDKTQATGLSWFVEINPLYHLVEIGRGPLIGKAPSILNWIYSICLSLTLFISGVISVNSNRSKIPFWV